MRHTEHLLSVYVNVNFSIADVKTPSVAPPNEFENPYTRWHRMCILGLNKHDKGETEAGKENEGGDHKQASGDDCAARGLSER